MSSVFCLAIIAYSCDKADHLSNNTRVQEDQLKARTVNACEDCPNETDCCCSVELSDPSTGSASLRFCGTTDGVGSCTGSTTGCPSFSGGGQSISLSTGIGNYRKLFCMAPGSALWVQNIGSATSVKISCQHGMTNPQIITLNLNPSDLVNFSLTDCMLIACP